MANIQKSLIVGIITLFASAVFAEDGSYYAGVGVGRADNTKFCPDTPFANTCDDTDTVGRVFGGYKLDDNWAFEGGYSDLGESDLSIGIKVNADASAWEVASLGILPINDMFSLYARAGLARVDYHIKIIPGIFKASREISTVPVFGVGATANVASNIVLRVDYRCYDNIGDKATTGETDINVMGVDATMSF